jgi:hypothetical protein
MLISGSQAIDETAKDYVAIVLDFEGADGTVIIDDV